MGSKYKKKLEQEWDGRCCSDIKIKTLQKQADENLSNVALGNYKRKRRYK